jgi:hypothetical protein
MPTRVAIPTLSPGCCAVPASSHFQQLPCIMRRASSSGKAEIKMPKGKRPPAWLHHRARPAGLAPAPLQPRLQPRGLLLLPLAGRMPAADAGYHQDGAAPRPRLVLVPKTQESAAPLPPAGLLGPGARCEWPGPVPMVLAARPWAETSVGPACFGSFCRPTSALPTKEPGSSTARHSRPFRAAPHWGCMNELMGHTIMLGPWGYPGESLRAMLPVRVRRPRGRSTGPVPCYPCSRP